MDFSDPLSFDPKTTDPTDPNFTLSPLADPVAGAVFASAEIGTWKITLYSTRVNEQRYIHFPFFVVIRNKSCYTRKARKVYSN